MRYSESRQLKTKRGQVKAKTNAWCLVHRKPMERHGKNFTCPGHWSTRINAVSGKTRSFVTHSFASTGWIRRYAGTKHTYPWCTQCKKRMVRRRRLAGTAHDTTTYLSFICIYCKAICSSRCAPSRFERAQRHSQVKEMIKQGYLNYQIVKKLRVHHSTVARLRGELTDSVALCQCGKLKHHNGGCEKKRDIRSLLYEQRTEFDRTVQQLSRVIPRGLPEDVRQDIAQEMFVDIRASIDTILQRVPEYLKQNNKWYSRIAPIDIDLMGEVAG